MPSERVVIVGGGIIGLSLAWHLKEKGRRVLVLDRGIPGREASLAGAGMLPLHSVAMEGDPLRGMAELSYRIYPGWVKRLRAQSGIDSQLRGSGALGLVFDGRGEKNAQVLMERLRRRGQKVEWWKSAKVRRHEPILSHYGRGALFLPETRHFHPAFLMRALEGSLKGRQVEISRESEALDFETRGGEITRMVTSRGKIPCAEIVLSGGAWSGLLGRKLGLEIPVKPLRGQVLFLRSRPGTLRHVLFGAGHYLVPRLSGEIYVGSTLEDSGFDKAVTPTGLAELGGAAAKISPVVAGLPVAGWGAGLRPASPDGAPFLGRIKGFSNLWIATGHHTHGHLLAPATGRLMAQALCHERTEISLDPFRLGRALSVAAPPWWVGLGDSPRKKGTSDLSHRQPRDENLFFKSRKK